MNLQNCLNEHQGNFIPNFTEDLHKLLGSFVEHKQQ